jgi:thioredoxin 2
MSKSIQIVCGHCDAVVRTPSDRIHQGPKCPKCHNPLFHGEPIELTASRFEKHLTRNDLPVIVDVWAPWCGPCKMMAPHFEEAARQFAPRARFAKVNSDEENALAARFGIRGIPTVIVFRDGREVARQSGAMDGAALKRWLTSALAQQ